jgi:hypothetical protein
MKRWKVSIWYHAFKRSKATCNSPNGCHLPTHPTPQHCISSSPPLVTTGTCTSLTAAETCCIPTQLDTRRPSLVNCAPPTQHPTLSSTSTCPPPIPAIPERDNAVPSGCWLPTCHPPPGPPCVLHGPHARPLRPRTDCRPCAPPERPAAPPAARLGPSACRPARQQDP